MCGIVGYVGRKTSFLNIANILQRLEYRGYDSAGISSLKNGKFNIIKNKGNISKLKEKITDKEEGSCLIAHTRWATHGEVNEINAHPHASQNNVWTIVHNGIIENFNEIKEQLKISPKSETDTAVVAQLLEDKNIETLEQFVDVFSNVIGSYAIVAEHKNHEKTLFVSKQKSPLYCAQNNFGDVLVASDPICFSGFSKDYYIFEDGEFAIIKPGQIKFVGKTKEIVNKTKIVLDEKYQGLENNNFSHFMLKEICEESVVLKNQVREYKEKNHFSIFNKEMILKFNKVLFVGCGTAYHAGLMGAKYISKKTKIYATAEIASELIYNEPSFIDSKTLCVFVSQSGETADTCRAMELAKMQGAFCVALTNVSYSTLARLADFVLPICAGVEIAVASTKAYVCQLSAIYMLASHISNVLFRNRENYFEKIEKVAEKILSFDYASIDRMAESFLSVRDAVFIGKDLSFVTAQESALKLKEVSYINAVGYASGELKHGFLALIENGTPLIAFAGDKKINLKTLNSASEAKARGANVIIVSNENVKECDNIVFVDEPDEFLFSILSITPMQYLAYKVSVLRNINPDQPRNLAKSVTVE